MPSLSLRDAQQAVRPSEALQSAANNSEMALTKALRVRGREELVAWLSQSWVAGCFIEYYDTAIHDWRIAMEAIEANQENMPRSERRSNQKLLVTGAVDALRWRNPRFLNDDVSKTYWTKDDHDIRFIVRLVAAGRSPGRCWEGQGCGPAGMEHLCGIAYRLMCWLRAMHRITLATSGMSRWHKVNCDRWFTVLSAIRRQNTIPTSEGAVPKSPLANPTDLIVEAPSTDLRPLDPDSIGIPSQLAHSAQISPLDGDLAHANLPENVASDPGPATTPPSTQSSPHTLLDESIAELDHSTPHSIIPDCDDTNEDPSTEDLAKSPEAATLSEHHNGILVGNFDDSHIKVEIESDSKDPPESFLGEEDQGTVQACVQTPQIDFQIPSVPNYRAPRSRNGMNQIKAIEWMTETGKKRFEAQQDTLLSSWGVTVEHAGTCILVPKSFMGRNPLDLIDDFEYRKCPPSGQDSRLVCVLGYYDRILC